MKRTLLLALGTTMLSGCVAGLTPEVDERLTKLPLQPHTGEVEVFFAGEWPKEEYLKVAALEARGSEATRYIDLINQLKSRAKAYGADAVIVQDKNILPDVHTSVVTGMVNTSGTSILAGVAIKYKKNLDMGLLPKQQQVEVYDPVSASYQPMLHLQLSPTGEIRGMEELRADAKSMYTNFIHHYSLRYLMEPGPGWSQHRQEGIVTERELHKGGLLLKQISFRYNKERQLQQVLINVPRGVSEEIRYTYDVLGRLVKRSITRGKQPYLLEEYTYDENGLVSAVEIFNAAMPDLILFMRSSFTYYTLEEI